MLLLDDEEDSLELDELGSLEELLEGFSDDELLLEEFEELPPVELVSLLLCDDSVSDERGSSMLEECLSSDDEFVGTVQAHKASIIMESTPNFNFDSTVMVLLIIG
ncbi:hypothetical protein SDC9_139558 [bioreactor metagenome]|uniref:Uncharacterized protein n=1 Tax=bioreactor metagenome TaxID=1076179 RepID=A0A645DV08_9ZZZZ